MYQVKSRCLLLIAISFFLGACASFKNYEIVTAPVVSMSHSKLPKNYRLKMGNHFISKFCEDHKPVHDTGELVGMADQAIYLAQKKNRATHLMDVRVSREGDCVIVVGNVARAYKIKRRKRRGKRVRDMASADDFEFTDEILPADNPNFDPMTAPLKTQPETL